jgi:hypothetical protein
VFGLRPHRIVATLAGAVIALAAATARADDLPGAYGDHGVSFSYPTAWLHVPGNFQVQSGSELWSEFFGPAPAPAQPPATDPAQPQPAAPAAPLVLPDVVAVAAYRTNVSITKKNLPRYKQTIQLLVTQLVTRANGKMLSGAVRVTMGGMPGCRFEATAALTDGTLTESRLVLVFRKKTEYFLNCQHVQNGPLTADIAGGCDQLMQSFRVTA